MGYRGIVIAAATLVACPALAGGEWLEPTQYGLIQSRQETRDSGPVITWRSVETGHSLVTSYNPLGGIEEMSEYGRPFAEAGEGRRPTLTWVRQIPIEGEPPDVAKIVAAYSEWLATSDVSKLFIKAEPGALLAGGANLDFARRLPMQTEVNVAGVHYVQEDSPDEIGRAVAGWIDALS